MIPARPSVAVVSSENVCVSEVSVSTKRPASMIDGPSSLVVPSTAKATGASFWPAIVTRTVWVAVPPWMSVTM